jgi:AraC-like DNA-binding protein
MLPALAPCSAAMRSTGPAVMAASAELVDALVPLERIGTRLNVRRNEDVYAKGAASVRRRKTFDISPANSTQILRRGDQSGSEIIFGEANKIPPNSIHTFTDPDLYSAALHKGLVQLTLKQCGVFNARLCTINLHHLSVQSFSEDLARTFHVESSGERAFIAFRTRPGPPIIRNGTELSTSSIALQPPCESYDEHTSGPTSHVEMSLPWGCMHSLSETTIRYGLLLRTGAKILTPLPDTMEKLKRLFKAAADLAEYAPAILLCLGAARGLEQALVEAIMECLGGSEVNEDRAALRRHAAIMRRFHRVIEEHLDQPLYITEICKEVGASTRTLNVCCQEHLGMAPKRYLLLRRMHMVRRALRDSSPAKTTVTEIATRYGFWQFGRLAAEYKALFGQLPSATLACLQ